MASAACAHTPHSDDGAAFTTPQCSPVRAPPRTAPACARAAVSPPSIAAPASAAHAALAAVAHELSALTLSDLDERLRGINRVLQGEKRDAAPTPAREARRAAADAWDDDSVVLQLSLLQEQHVFNACDPLVERVLGGLVRALPRESARVRAMHAAPGVVRGASRTPAYASARNMLAHATERFAALVRGDHGQTLADAVIQRVRYTTRGAGANALRGARNYLHDAVRVARSPAGTCAGVIGRAGECPHERAFNGAAPDARLAGFVWDHVYPVVRIAQLVHERREEIAHAADGHWARFVMHLLYATQTDTEYGWPPNVYVRCVDCDADGEHAHALHEHLFERVCAP